MASLTTWTREALRPAPLPHRPRWIHWTAWVAAIFAFALLAAPLLGERLDFLGSALIGWLDLATCAFFVLEFFTRSGFRKDRWNYAKWRWFDFLGMVPVIFLAPHVGFLTWFLWLVMAARAARLIDRTLGDGFVKRNVLALTEAVEEEITDRVMGRILARLESELRASTFGTTAAAALAANREGILRRIYEEQRPEGTLAKMAVMTGVQTALERMEARVLDAIIKMVGSQETDALIRDVITASLSEARAEISKRSWKEKVGLAGPAPDA